METTEVSKIEVIKKRGGWLSTFLVLMFIANPITAFVYFSNPEMIVQAYPKMTFGILNFMGAMAILNVILAAGIWTWNKWAIYGFYVVVAIALCINLYVGVGITGSFAGLVGAVIIYFTTRNRWEHFS